MNSRPNAMGSDTNLAARRGWRFALFAVTAASFTAACGGSKASGGTGGSTGSSSSSSTSTSTSSSSASTTSSSSSSGSSTTTSSSSSTSSSTSSASSSTSGGPLTCGDANYKCAFVSSKTYDGNLGGLSGADATCGTLAATAGLNGKWRAWLGDAFPISSSPSTRFLKATVPYKLVDGTTIAANYAALTTGNLQNPIARDETGAVVAMTHVWSNVDQTGAPQTFDCTGWQSNASTGMGGYGIDTHTDGNWTSDLADACNTKQPIYCVEQDATTADCASDGACPSGDFCNQGACDAKRGVAKGCTTGSQCISGVCTVMHCN